MRALSVLAIAAGFLALVATGNAQIVPQRSIAGVSLHMTKAQVRARLGQPARVRSGRNDFGRYTTFVYRRVTISFQSGSKVSALRTLSRQERTSAGVGVGSSEAQVKARVPRVVCNGARALGSRQCVVGKLLPGRVVTAFWIKRGHVDTVVVGIVLD